MIRKIVKKFVRKIERHSRELSKKAKNMSPIQPEIIETKTGIRIEFKNLQSNTKTTSKDDKYSSNKDDK